MAFYAILDADNIVVAVISGRDPGAGAKDNQAHWESYYSVKGQKALMTDYGGVYRKNYAGIGYRYLQNIDAFIPPSPYPSWVVDENTAQWIAPIAYPNDNKRYGWDETTGSWVELPPR